MARPEDEFTFEDVEEHIEQSFQSFHEIARNKQSDPNMQLLVDLQRFYREEPADVRSVEQVRDRFAQVLAQRENDPTPLPEQRLQAAEKDERPRPFVRPPFSRKRRKNFFFHMSVVAALLLLALLVGSMAIVVNLALRSRSDLANHPTITIVPFPKTRDPLTWPFAQNSIWNMPVGSQARYVPAKIHHAGIVSFDEDYFIVTSSSDPEYPVYTPGPWATGRCSGTQYIETIHFPQNLVVPDAKNGFTPTNAAAILQPDGRSLVQIEPLARCQAGGNIYGWVACGWGSRQDIEGDGLCGGHFNSGLSSIGGMIRSNELFGDQPIRHALQLEIWMEAYGYYSQQIPGHRWPAFVADDGAKDRYCTLDPCKNHPNKSLTEGSLLALPLSLTPEKLGIKTEAGKKMFYALQNYGGYVVADSGRDCFQIGVEKGVPADFARIYGYPFGEGAFHDDINKLFPALAVIDNNSSTSIGGGGIPRAPLAPPFIQSTTPPAK